MRRSKPPEFDLWLEEIGMVADTLGAWALVGVWMGSPVECNRYLVTVPGAWEGLLARGHFADRRRFEMGVCNGRRVGT